MTFKRFFSWFRRNVSGTIQNVEDTCITTKQRVTEKNHLTKVSAVVNNDTKKIIEIDSTYLPKSINKTQYKINMKLNEEQKYAATYNGKERNILVTAGAGCGKTRTIIARAIHLIKTGHDASQILMITFTNRAAKEIKNRLKSEFGATANKAEVGTFHSFCLKAISKAPKSFGIVGLNIIDSEDQKSLMTLIRNQYINKSDKQLNKSFPKASILLGYYSYSRNTCDDPSKYLDNNTELSKEYIHICLKIFNGYQESKEKRGYLDFDDLLVRFSKALKDKPKLRSNLAGIFKEVLIDEMQDTNPLQFSILKHFSTEKVRLFCVGDPAQSIYKFRGAEFKYVYSFAEKFGDSKIINLSLNYRSYQEILDFSNWLLSKSPFNYSNQLKANRRSCGYLPKLCDFESSYDEASWISDVIQERNTPLRDVMVLVRTAYDAKPIEAEFIQREIPYKFVGGTSLTKSAHVRDVLSLIRVVRNSNDDLAWLRYLTLWPRIGERTASKIINLLHENRGRSVKDNLTIAIGKNHEFIDSYEEALNLIKSPKQCVNSAVSALSKILEEKYDKWTIRRHDLNLLVKVSEHYASISDFIDAFTLEPMTSSEINKNDVDDLVTLITVHSAKGTEAPICFVANAKQGSYPHIRSCGDIDSEEEERRVLYVAFTRAKNELFVTRSAEHGYGFHVQNKPTEGEEYFLSEIPNELVKHEINGWKPDQKRGLSSLKDIY